MKERRNNWEQIFSDSELFLSERVEACWSLILAVLTPVTKVHQNAKRKKQVTCLCIIFLEAKGRPDLILFGNAGNLREGTGKYTTILHSLGSRQDDCL